MHDRSARRALRDAALGAAWALRYRRTLPRPLEHRLRLLESLNGRSLPTVGSQSPALLARDG